MTVQSFTLANITDLTGGGITATAAGATYAQVAQTSYIFVTFAGAVTVTLNRALFGIGQEINIADRANFAGRLGAPIKIQDSGSVFLFGAGAAVASVQITKPMGTLTLFWDGTYYGIKCSF